MDDLRRLLDDPEGSALGRSLIAAAADDAPSPTARARAARRLGVAAVLAAGAGAGSEAGAAAAAWKLAAVLLALGGVVGLAVWQAPAREPVAPERGRVVAHASPAASGDPGHAPAVLPPEAAQVQLPAVPPAVAPAAAPSSQPAAIAAPAPTASPASLPSGAAGVAAASRTARPGASTPVARQLVGRPVVPAGVPVAPVVPVAPPSVSPDALTPEAPVSASPEGPEVAASTEAVPSPEAAVPPEAVPSPEAVAPPEVAASPEVTAPPAVAAGPGRLAEETALIDRGRGHLARGDHAAALAALAEYHQRFASGDLDAEADVVTLEIVIAQRELPRARALGAAFLARFPRSPLARRVHSLLDHLPK